MMRMTRTPPRLSRRGGALMVVIVALAVASMVGATLLQMAFTQRRQQQHDRLRVQAAWLAEAGLHRGLQRARTDDAYRGETWMVDVPGRAEALIAEVQITIDATDNRTVTAVATYPATTTFRARVRRAISVNPSSTP